MIETPQMITDEHAAHTSLVAVILTQNEEVNLPDCLNSLRGLNCNILVVDSGSTDRSAEIAAEAGAWILHHPFENYAAQRNWAQAQLPSDVWWVLHLDADERLTPPLVDEIRRVLADPQPDINGFLLRKRTIFMGRWIRHGGHYPSYHLRLFRTAQGRCEDRLYDQHFVVAGPVGRLQHEYFDVIGTDIATWINRHVRWAALEAAETATGRPAAAARIAPSLVGDPIQRRRWWRDRMYARAPLFIRAVLYWFYRYVLRLGFLDGVEGLIFHSLQGFWFRFVIDAMVYERRRQDAALRNMRRS